MIPVTGAVVPFDAALLMRFCWVLRATAVLNPAWRGKRDVTVVHPDKIVIELNPASINIGPQGARRADRKSRRWQPV